MKTSVDFNRHVSLHLNCLTYLGLWYYIPHPIDSVWFWMGMLNRVALGLFSFVLSTGAQIVYLVRLVLSGESDVLEITGILNLVITEILSELKFLDMRLRRDKFSKLLDLLKSKEFQCGSQQEIDICEKAIRMSRWLFIIVIFFGSLDIFVHVVIVPCLAKFETLPLKMDFIFFDVNDPKYFNYVCAYQILYKPFMIATFVTHQTLPWAAMSFTMSQLDVLIYNFENMKELVKSTRIERNCDENEAFRQTFRELVLRHSATIRFINVIQETFGGQLSAYLFVSAFILGTTALQFFSIESPLSNIVDVFWLLTYLNIFVGMLFVDCYFGNSITDKCEKLSTCVFSCPWTSVSNDLKKSVIIFIAKTQQPVVITAAKLVPVSLQTFTKVMNWTYKGFAVINQMK